MSRTNYLFKLVTIDSVKPRDKACALTDGGGLLLEVLSFGIKSWRFKDHPSGKREKAPIRPTRSSRLATGKKNFEPLVEREESPTKAKLASVAARKVAKSREDLALYKNPQ